MFKSIDQTDPDFRFVDGYVMVPRAEIHVTHECPANVASMLYQAYANGWIKLSANIRDSEYTWEKLQS